MVEYLKRTVNGLLNVLKAGFMRNSKKEKEKEKCMEEEKKQECMEEEKKQNLMKEKENNITQVGFLRIRLKRECKKEEKNEKNEECMKEKHITKYEIIKKFSNIANRYAKEFVDTHMQDPVINAGNKTQYFAGDIRIIGEDYCVMKKNINEISEMYSEKFKPNTAYKNGNKNSKYRCPNQKYFKDITASKAREIVLKLTIKKLIKNQGEELLKKFNYSFIPQEVKEQSFYLERFKYFLEILINPHLYCIKENHYSNEEVLPTNGESYKEKMMEESEGVKKVFKAPEINKISLDNNKSIDSDEIAQIQSNPIFIIKFCLDRCNESQEDIDSKKIISDCKTTASFSEEKKLPKESSDGFGLDNFKEIPKKRESPKEKKPKKKVKKSEEVKMDFEASETNKKNLFDNSKSMNPDEIVLIQSEPISTIKSCSDKCNESQEDIDSKKTINDSKTTESYLEGKKLPKEISNDFGFDYFRVISKDVNPYDFLALDDP